MQNFDDKNQTDFTPNNGGALVKGVIVGIILDLIFSITISLFFLVIIGCYLSFTTGSTPEESVSLSIAIVLNNGNIVFYALNFVTLFGTMVASYICCRIAKQSALKAVMICAGIMIFFAFLTGFIAFGVLENIILSLLNLPAYYAGYWLYQKNRI